MQFIQIYQNNQITVYFQKQFKINKINLIQKLLNIIKLQLLIMICLLI